MSTKPNFFIVGGPKCGTTSLNEYLKAHPEIFIPEKKEIHYFGTDLSNSQYVRTEKGYGDAKYLELFQDCTTEKAIGETSVFYLFSRNAPEEIKSFSQNARIIVMVRNPVDVMYSMHSQNLFGRDEDIEDFEGALLAEQDRIHGKRYPKKNRNREALLYRKIVKFSDQIERYLEWFSRENVKIVIFDEFKENATKVYREVAEFLEVSTQFIPEFSIANPNKRLRSKLIDDFLRFTVRNIRKPSRALMPSRKLRRFIVKGIRAVNTEYGARAPLDENLRRLLIEEQIPEIKRLEGLTGVPLSGWYSM